MKKKNLFLALSFAKAETKLHTEQLEVTPRVCV